MAADVETRSVGAGVVGLAIARALALPGSEVLVLERHDRIGTETSSRNSEVIHAGIYYPPGSLRAKLCVAGKELLYRFCAENGVTHMRCGKLLVATQEAEVAKLEAIAAIAGRTASTICSGCRGDDVRALEPEVTCVAAYLSPSTGIIDSHGLMQALEGPPDGTRRRGRAQRVGDARQSPSGDAGDFRHRDAQRRRDERAHRAQPRARGGLGATALGRMLTYPARLRRARDLPRARTLLRARRTRAVPPPRLPDADRRLARRAPHARRRAAAPASAPTSSGATASSYAFDDDGGKRRTLRERDPPLLAGPARSARCTPTASACARRSIARASRSPISPSTARRSTACRASSRSTAWRAPGSRPRSPSVITLQRCCAERTL